LEVQAQRDFSTEYKETGAATVSDKKKQVLSDMESGEGYDRSSLDLLGDQENCCKLLQNRKTIGCYLY
jgi:hypothetical protein